MSYPNQKKIRISKAKTDATHTYAMLNYRDKNGKPYSPVYLKTLHNQLSAVFNHAVKHYNLKANPAAQVGNSLFIFLINLQCLQKLL